MASAFTFSKVCHHDRMNTALSSNFLFSVVVAVVTVMTRHSSFINVERAE